jgi:hypothetical protein
MQSQFRLTPGFSNFSIYLAVLSLVKSMETASISWAFASEFRAVENVDARSASQEDCVCAHLSTATDPPDLNIEL